MSMDTLPVQAKPDAAPRAAVRDRAQEVRLFERYRATGDPAARAALVERFLPLARSLAGRYRRRGEYDDLVQVASYALIKAIDRYDPGRGLAFSSFAVPTILGELKRHFRDHGWAVRVPRELQERALEVRRTSEQLGAQLGRSPTPAEIAFVMDSNVELILEALQTASAHRPDRLDTSTEHGDRESTHPRIGAEDDGYALAEAAATLQPLLGQLSPRERTILRLRFEDDLTQSEIGALLGISQMQVSRLLRRAIATLQHLAGAAPSGAAG